MAIGSITKVIVKLMAKHGKAAGIMKAKKLGFNSKQISQATKKRKEILSWGHKQEQGLSLDAKRAFGYYERTPRDINMGYTRDFYRSGPGKKK